MEENTWSKYMTEAKKMKYIDRHDLFPDKVIISYPFRWGGQLKDRWMWMAELNGEVRDYDSREALVEDAIREGIEYVVLRVHRNADISILAPLNGSQKG